MRLLPHIERSQTQKNGTSGDWREERDLDVQENITYFLICLEKDRKTRYINRKQPDTKNHTTPEPDCIVEESGTGRQVAIEYSELRVAAEMPRMRRELNSVGFTIPPVLKGEDLASKLAEAIEQKKDKGQFKNYPNAEKILLFKDCVSGRHKIQEFLECYPYFQQPDEPGCDHCYIILRKNGDILQLF